MSQSSPTHNLHPSLAQGSPSLNVRLTADKLLTLMRIYRYNTLGGAKTAPPPVVEAAGGPVPQSTDAASTESGTPMPRMRADLALQNIMVMIADAPAGELPTQRILSPTKSRLRVLKYTSSSRTGVRTIAAER